MILQSRYEAVLLIQCWLGSVDEPTARRKLLRAIVYLEHGQPGYPYSDFLSTRQLLEATAPLDK